LGTALLATPLMQSWSLTKNYENIRLLKRPTTTCLIQTCPKHPILKTSYYQNIYCPTVHDQSVIYHHSLWIQEKHMAVDGAILRFIAPCRQTANCGPWLAPRFRLKYPCRRFPCYPIPATSDCMHETRGTRTHAGRR